MAALAAISPRQVYRALAAAFNMNIKRLFSNGPKALGVGVDNMALQEPIVNQADYHLPRFAITGSFRPMSGATNTVPQSVPEIDLKGNGFGAFEGLRRNPLQD